MILISRQVGEPTINECVEIYPSGTDNTYLAMHMVVFEAPCGYFMDGSPGEGFVLSAFARADWHVRGSRFLDRGCNRVGEGHANPKFRGAYGQLFEIAEPHGL
jgi:hypothetical protein